MKYISSLIILTFLLVSCNSEQKEESLDSIIATGDIQKLKSKKKEIEATQLSLTDDLDLLNEEIKKLDTIQRYSQITTFKAEKEQFVHFLELQGSVSTKQNIVIFPEYNGILSHVYVKEGQRVSRGQQLAKIDDGGMGQQLAQLEIQSDLAKTTYERQKRLWDQQIGSEIQYLQAKSNYEAQEKAVEQLKQQLSKTIVRAPFSGIIDDVITDQGSVVGAGMTQLMRIVNLNDMYIETQVPENYLTSVITGKKVWVEFPMLAKTVETEVRQAGNFINSSNRTFKIEIPVPNKDNSIKPNLTAKLKINDYTSDQAFLIPQSVISENALGQQYLYIVENKSTDNIGTTKRVIVTTGLAQDDQIEVLTGLEIGMEIIQEGARSVKENQEVEIINQ